MQLCRCCRLMAGKSPLVDDARYRGSLGILVPCVRHGDGHRSGDAVAAVKILTSGLFCVISTTPTNVSPRGTAEGAVAVVHGCPAKWARNNRMATAMVLLWDWKQQEQL